MKILFFLGFLILMVIPCHPQTVGKEDIIDRELSTCLKKAQNQTTAGMCNCTYAALDKWDRKLNDTYKKLLTKLQPASKGKLIEAQRQWVIFKEKEIELIDATYGSAEGTMWTIVRADKVLSLTKGRAVELESLFKTLDMM